MKISVITPVFNVEDYLPACIDSVLKQTYCNYELILMDDGSTDGSGTICDLYSKKYPEHIRTIHLQNRGPLRARLLGIKEASGDLVAFLDADDCLRKDAIEIIVAHFLKDNCDMLLYDAEECAEFDSIIVTHTLNDGTVFEEVSKKELYRNIILGVIPNSLCLKAIRKECATFSELFLNYTARHGEDLLMSVCFITNAKKVVYIKEGLYHYRNRPGSAIHSFSIERKESIKIVHTELEKYVYRWGIPELKQIHNARKVRGWVDNFILLIKNRKFMSGFEFRKQFCSMVQDPYFRSAYIDMDKNNLSISHRMVAFLMYHFLFI